MTVRRALLGASIAVLLFSSPLAAQTATQRVQIESRTDLIASRWTSGQGGIGVTFPAGIYVRTGGVIAAGGGSRGFESRVDLVSRFTLDPYRENRWGFYAGGGVSGRYTQRASPKEHAYLFVFAGLEGPLKNASVAGWVPAVEVGLGGGTRIGIGLRQGIPGRR